MGRDWWADAVAEMIGTMTLIVAGAGAVVTNQMTGGAVGVVGIALAHGLAIAVMVAALGHISGGHFNPAITAGFVATGRLRIGPGLVYVAAQLVGASLGAFVLTAVFPEAARTAVALGTPAPSAGVSPGTAIIVEMVLTFFLVTVVFGTAVDKRGPVAPIAGLAIGLTITMDILAGGGLTGAAMNPARAFGPALFANVWTAHYVYWIGPLLGGILAAAIYHSVLMRGEGG